MRATAAGQWSGGVAGAATLCAAFEAGASVRRANKRGEVWPRISGEDSWGFRGLVLDAGVDRWLFGSGAERRDAAEIVGRESYGCSDNSVLVEHSAI